MLTSAERCIEIAMQSLGFSVSPFLPTRRTLHLHAASWESSQAALLLRDRPSRSARDKHLFTRMTKHHFSSVETIEWLKTPVAVSGKVQRGFGRGSRDLGTPTANLPGKLVDDIAEVDRDGVYLGYGRVPKFGTKVVKMVANLGRNITYGDVEERVLEAYLMTDEYDKEFYDEEMRLCIIGFLRPEWKFNSMDELIKHIRNDVAVSEAALNLPEAVAFRSHLSLIM